MGSKNDQAAREAQQEVFVVWAQLLCFIASFLTGLATTFPSPYFDLAVKVTDALFICGCMLLAVKYAREKIDMAAAGFTIVAISWGFVGASIDFDEMTGIEMFSSAIYFLIPGMWLIGFNTEFPLWLRLVTGLLCWIPMYIFALEIPHMVEMIEKKEAFDWPLSGYLGFGAVHWVSLAWAIVIFVQFKKEKSKAKSADQ